MQGYLERSISSLNQNKLRGLMAEIEFRTYLNSLGFADNVSVGGWIARTVGSGIFGHHTVVMFPHAIQPGIDYPATNALPEPSHGLHTICATFHQIGIHSYFCAPIVNSADDPASIRWNAVQLGLPTQQPYEPFPDNIAGFHPRTRAYTHLRYHTDVSGIPIQAVPDEFSKEHLRVTFQQRWMSEISDIDGILWGHQYTYPIEIKEKTAAPDDKLGDWFGLDLGPFVKLAFYAAKRGNLHSIFVVREIGDVTTRNLVNWWFITFERLASFASWNPQSGGASMTGGRSTVVKIPKAEFQELNARTLAEL